MARQAITAAVTTIARLRNTPKIGPNGAPPATATIATNSCHFVIEVIIGALDEFVIVIVGQLGWICGLPGCRYQSRWILPGPATAERP